MKLKPSLDERDWAMISMVLFRILPALDHRIVDIEELKNLIARFSSAIRKENIRIKNTSEK